MIDDKFLAEYENLLYQTERPSRYIGDEYGSYDKDFNLAEGKFLFVFPAAFPIVPDGADGDGESYFG